MNHIYKRYSKEVNGDHNYLMCTYLQYKYFVVLCADIALDKIYLACEDTVREKHTRNDVYFINSSNTIHFMVYG